MSRRLWALALAVLMIASAVVAVPAVTHAGAASAAPTTESSGARVAAGTIGIGIFNGYGYSSTTYTSGTSPAATMFFEILDASGDLSVNVTINDPNATRDGVGAPAFHLEVPINTTTSLYKSWLTGVRYNLPAALVYGGIWNLTAEAPLGGTTVQTFTVDTYYLTTSATPNSGSVVLPGESVTLLWQILSDQYDQSGYGGPYTHVTNLTMTGTYTGFNGTVNITMPVFPHQWASLAIAPIGQTTLTIPDNATPGYYVTVDLYATVFLNGQIVENQSGGVSFLVGFPIVDYAYTYYEPTSTCPYANNYYFSVGQPIFACAVAGAGYGGSFTPVAGLAVGIHYTNDSSTVTVAGAPTSLITNTAGEIIFSFVATSPPFTWSEIGYPYVNSVNYTVSDSSATAWAETHYHQFYADEFYLQEAAATGDVSVLLNQAVYFPGQTISATWTLGTSNSTVTGPLTPLYWELENSAYAIIGEGALSGGSSTGAATVTLPTGYMGTFYYGVFAANATTVFAGWASASVTAPLVYVNPSSLTYSAGSTVSVAVSMTGTGSATGLTLHYTVLAYYYSRSARLPERRSDRVRHRSERKLVRPRRAELGPAGLLPHRSLARVLDRCHPRHDVGRDRRTERVCADPLAPDDVQVLGRELPAGGDAHLQLHAVGLRGDDPAGRVPVHRGPREQSRLPGAAGRGFLRVLPGHDPIEPAGRLRRGLHGTGRVGPERPELWLRLLLQLDPVHRQPEPVGTESGTLARLWSHGRLAHPADRDHPGRRGPGADVPPAPLAARNGLRLQHDPHVPAGPRA